MLYKKKRERNSAYKDLILFRNIQKEDKNDHITPHCFTDGHLEKVS